MWDSCIKGDSSELVLVIEQITQQTLGDDGNDIDGDDERPTSTHSITYAVFGPNKLVLVAAETMI